MYYIYTNKQAGERLESEGDYNCEDILKLLQKLVSANSTLITKLPSGIGLDFSVQENGQLFLEIYAETLSSAFVTKQVAEKVIRRAFMGIDCNIKASYGDLISKWET